MKKRILCLMMIIAVLVCQIPVYAKSYEYDDMNRVTKVTYDDGSYAIYEYDKNGNITNIKIYNKNGESIKPEETTAKEESNSEKEHETTKREESTTKKEQGTTKREENTTKREQEITEKKQEETTSKKEQGNHTAQEIQKEKEQKILEDLNRKNETTRDNLTNAATPFRNVNEYIANTGKKNDTSVNNPIIYQKNTVGSTQQVGNNAAVDKEEILKKISLKIETYFKQYVVISCDWLIKQSFIRQIKQAQKAKEQAESK